MTDIFEMSATQEQKKNILLKKTCSLIKRMNDEGTEKTKIYETINNINLPFDIHIAVTGRFSEICKFGRILTESERKLFKL